MHPAFAVIRFGPFKSRYHRDAVDVDFREALSDYLTAQLLPQVDELFESTAGTLRATYDDQKYCGPNSAVRDLYSLEFEFRRPSGSDAIQIDLAFSAKLRSFSPRYRGRPLYLWTAARKQTAIRRRSEIEEVCRRILDGEISPSPCPWCDAGLRITNLPALFDISCPNNCFNYNFHRDPETGVFQHGHFFCQPRE